MKSPPNGKGRLAAADSGVVHAGTPRITRTANVASGTSPRLYRRRKLDARHAYWRLLVSRFKAGLLEPFRCAKCRVVALDPIGWSGPREPLCERCAGWEGMGQ
jgi:hypothetical protein